MDSATLKDLILYCQKEPSEVNVIFNLWYLPEIGELFAVILCDAEIKKCLSSDNRWNMFVMFKPFLWKKKEKYCSVIQELSRKIQPDEVSIKKH